MVISKNCKFCSEIKFVIENAEHLRQKLRVENFESKILSEFQLNELEIWSKQFAQHLHSIGANTNSKLAVAHFLCKKLWHWMDGWVSGWVDGWMDGWMLKPV